MDPQPSTLSFPNEKAKAAHTKLSGAKAVMQQTQALVQSTSRDLQDTMRHYDQTTEEYNRALDHVDSLQQRVNQRKLFVERDEEALRQQANRYQQATSTYSAQRQEFCHCNNCYEKNTSNTARFEVQKQQFLSACQQLQKTQQDYQQTLSTQQQATSVLQPLREELNKLQQIKEHQTTQRDYHVAVLTMLQENVQSAERQYEASLISPLFPHPNLSQRSYSTYTASMSSTASVISDTSTRPTLSMNHHTGSDTNTEFSYSSASPPSSPIPHAMAGTKTPSPVKLTHKLNWSPSQFLITDSPH